MSTQGLIVLPNQGAVWNMGVDRVATFRLLSEQTQDHIAVFEETVPTGTSTPLHIHHSSDEVMYILTGELTFKLGEQVMNVSAGSWIMIPRGVAHAWKNSGNKAGRLFFIFTPADGAKLFEELRKFDLPSASIDPATKASLRQRYGYELVDLQPFE